MGNTKHLTIIGILGVIFFALIFISTSSSGISSEYSFNDIENRVEMEEKPWVIKSDDGIDSYSLYAAPVVLAMIMQIKKILLG